MLMIFSFFFYIWNAYQKIRWQYQNSHYRNDQTQSWAISNAILKWFEIGDRKTNCLKVEHRENPRLNPLDKQNTITGEWHGCHSKNYENVFCFFKYFFCIFFFLLFSRILYIFLYFFILFFVYFYLFWLFFRPLLEDQILYVSLNIYFVCLAKNYENVYV